jgi:hypothetical protein
LTIGNLTDAGTDGITVTGGTGAVIGSGTSIAQHVADASHNGYLSSSDWTTFNNKGSGSVTSVGLSVPATSILGVTGSPVTGSGTLGLTTTGISGGVPYFSSTTQLASSALLTANQLIVGGGAGAAPVTLAAGSQYQVLVMGASNPGYGQVNLGQSAAVTGTLLAAQFPALTGDITTVAGALATTAAATQANISTLSKSSGVAVHGTNTNDSASSGYIGEVITANPGSSVSISNTAWATITSVSLTAGDWDVEGTVVYTAGASSGTVEIGAAISTTTNGTDSLANGGVHHLYLNGGTGGKFADSQTQYIPTGVRRLSLSSTTTVYLVGIVTVASGTGTSFTTSSFIRARRMR